MQHETINTFTRLPREMRTWLEARAKAERRSVSNMIARLLEQAREQAAAAPGEEERAETPK